MMAVAGEGDAFFHCVVGTSMFDVIKPVPLIDLTSRYIWNKTSDTLPQSCSGMYGAPRHSVLGQGS